MYAKVEVISKFIWRGFYAAFMNMYTAKKEKKDIASNFVRNKTSMKAQHQSGARNWLLEVLTMTQLHFDWPLNFALLREDLTARGALKVYSHEGTLY